MPISLCMFGDSVARGVVFDAVREKYLFLKDSFISLVGGAASVCVDNYAKFGCTVTKGNEIVKKHAAKLGGYDAIALEFGGNDCDYDWAAISRDPKAKHLPKTPLAAFEDVYAGIIREVRASGARPAVFTLPPIDAERYFAHLSRGLNRENILLWLGDIGRIYRWHERYNTAVCAVAAREGALTVDIRTAFLERDDYRSLICEDGIHPTQKGHALIADVVEGYLGRAALTHG